MDNKNICEKENRASREVVFEKRNYSYRAKKATLALQTFKF
jgi:hypothetical protein